MATAYQAQPVLPKSAGLEAQYVSGDVTMVPRDNANAGNLGEVEVVGDKPYINHTAIAANEYGAHASFGGVYLVPKATGGGSAIAKGAKLYWNDSTNVVATSGAHKHFGIAESAAADGDTHLLASHNPDGSTGTP